MNTRRISLLGIAVLTAACSPKVVQITATPANAKIYKYTAAGDTVGLGTAAAALKFDDGRDKIDVLVVADGFESIRKSLTPADATAAGVPIHLSTRVVKITVSQPDAEIVVDNRVVGTGREPFRLRLGADQSSNVEVRRRGFKSEVRTYANRVGADAPPTSVNFDLNQRTVSLKATPTVGTRIEQAGQPIGEGQAQVVIPKDACQVIRIVRTGFVPQERTYCQRDGEPAPPESETFQLRDRLVNVTTQPENADITVAGKKVGSGSYPLTVKEGTCVEIAVTSNAFLPYSKEYCNQENTTAPPETDYIKLSADESWSFSTASDQANVNFNIDVSESHTSDDAWKLIAQIATQNFDVIEVTDKETGYLRTGWNVWQRPGGRVIRTRVIIKQASTTPVKYSLKLQSEWAPAGTSVKDDERFRPWDRILLTYKDLINEAQSRLR